MTKLKNVYELNKRCKKERTLKRKMVLKNKKNNYGIKASIVKQAINAILMGYLNFTPDSIREYLLSEFNNQIETDNVQQTMEMMRVSLMEIIRYVSYINAHKIFPTNDTINVDIAGMVQVPVRPDFAIMTEYASYIVLDMVKIKDGRPNISLTSVRERSQETLPLLAMLCYGKEYAKQLNITKDIYVSASYHFLTRCDDKHSGDEHIDANFTSSTGARNILTLSENNRENVSDIENSYKPLIQKFIDGYEPEEITDKECERCPYHDICKYEIPPAAIKQENKRYDIRSLKFTKGQQEAIMFNKGVARVNAGAGSGKTTLITARTLHMIMNGIQPESIAMFTFTNAATEEMRDRVSNSLKDCNMDIDPSRIHISTFNAFGDEIIKDEYLRFGYTEPPKIIDEEEKSIIIAEILKNNHIEGLDYRNFDMNMRYALGALAMVKEIFNFVKKRNMAPTIINAKTISVLLDKKAGSLTSPSNDPEKIDVILPVMHLYSTYAQKLIEHNLIDYIDQEILVKQLLQQEPNYLNRFGFSHIVVDEFQDTSKEQINILKALMDNPNWESLMVVGDDSQSIYGFRNTSPEFMINLPQVLNMPVKDIYIENNFRSTPQIVDFANAINDNNANKIDKSISALRPNGKAVTLEGFENKVDEENYVIKGIKNHIINGRKPEDIAIIAATKSELLKMQLLLSKENIPSVLLNPEPYCENSSVRACIALTAVLQDMEDTQALMVYLNAYSRGKLFDMPIENIQQGIDSCMASLRQFHELSSDKERKQYFMLLAGMINPDDEVYENFLEIFANKSISSIFTYCNKFYKYGDKNAIRRLEEYPGVVLTTAHSSKGLEWPVVYNMISKYHSGALQFEEKEEKRRLFFVSSTRARDELYITSQIKAYGPKRHPVYNMFYLEAKKILNG